MDTSISNARNKRVSSSSKAGSAKKERKYRIGKRYRKAKRRVIEKASDGELYSLIREHMKKENEQGVDECRNRLSGCKQISLNGLLLRVPILRRLDQLQIFPGILSGLELGNVHKHLSLHCDSNIIHFLESHIKNTWLDITGNEPSVQRHVDPITVRRLQFRVPAASASDRRLITQMFDDGDIFEGMSDTEMRERVKQNVLALKVVIPSVESFHENMKFFSLGMKIIRKNIADPSPRGSWLEMLMKSWHLPSVPYVETAHGRLKPFVEPHFTAQLAFTQLFLAALRNFPYLCSEHPRQDRRGELMPAYALASMTSYLSELAFTLGFNNKTIDKNMRRDIKEHSSIEFRPEPGSSADWRGGKPFTKTFFALRSQAFLSKLSRPLVSETEPSPLFILKDFMQAFFGSFETVVVDENKSSMALVAAAASAKPGKSRSQNTTAKIPVKEKRSYRVGKHKRAQNGTVAEAKLLHALVHSSHGPPIHSRLQRESFTPFSKDKQSNGTETFTRQFYRSPIPSPTELLLRRTGRTLGGSSRVAETHNSDSDSGASVFSALNHSALDITPRSDTPHRVARSPMSGFGRPNWRNTDQTTSSASSARSASTPGNQPSRVAATASGKSEGGWVMPDRNVRSYLGQGSNVRRDNSQLAVRIPPIRSMRTARKPQSCYVAQLEQGSVVGQNSLEGGSPLATGRLDLSFDPAAEQTRLSELVLPTTPLRPEPNDSRHSGPFFTRGVKNLQDGSRGEAARSVLSEGNGQHRSTTRRHAVYFPATAEGRGWFGSEKMPFGRPRQKVGPPQRGKE